MLPEGVPKTHLITAIPACGRMTTVRWGINLCLQEYPLSMGQNCLSVKGAEAGVSRNQIVEMGQRVKNKLLYMVDDDVLPPTYAPQKLLFAMLNKPDVMAVAGIVYTKTEVPYPLVFNNEGEGPYLNWKRGQIFEVPGFISTGCILIKMEVFDKIEKPWFESRDYPDKCTEDVTWCWKVMKAGYKILGHGGVICGHYNHRTRTVVYPSKESELILAQ